MEKSRGGLPSGMAVSRCSVDVSHFCFYLCGLCLYSPHRVRDISYFSPFFFYFFFFNFSTLRFICQLWPFSLIHSSRNLEFESIGLACPFMNQFLAWEMGCSEGK